MRYAVKWREDRRGCIVFARQGHGNRTRYTAKTAESVEYEFPEVLTVMTHQNPMNYLECKTATRMDMQGGEDKQQVGGGAKVEHLLGTTLRRDRTD